MIAPLVRKVRLDFAFQLVAFDLRQIVASDKSGAVGIVLMDAFVPLADCAGSGTCLGAADFEGTTGNIAVVQLVAYFESLAEYCFALYFCVFHLCCLVVVHTRYFSLTDSHYTDHSDCYCSDSVRKAD